MKKENEIKDNLYPIIKKNINLPKIKKCIGEFISDRSEQIYDIAPCDRIYFGVDDLDNFFKSINVSQKEVQEKISTTYYYNIKNFNPSYAKDEFTIALMCLIRYFLCEKKDEKTTELLSIYLSFSGKFYPSIHYASFPVVQPSQYRYVMEYVVNNELSNRYDIKKEGNVYGVIRSINNTWLTTYKKLFESFSDEDIVYLVQQLHTRVASFIRNIAEIYYDVYNRKDAYLTYDSDDLSEDNYHLMDNDRLKIDRIVEKSMHYINNNSVDEGICITASDKNVKYTEVKSIIESILSDNKNLPEVKEFITLLVTIFFANSKTKDIHDINFLTISITPKPNSKDSNVNRAKEIVESWLNEKSPAYRKRKSREATKSSYHKSINAYFALLIYKANK